MQYPIRIYVYSLFLSFFFVYACINIFYLHVDRSSFKTFTKSVLLISHVFHPKNRCKNPLQIVQTTFRYTYCTSTTILFIYFEAYFFWMQTTLQWSQFLPQISSPFGHINCRACIILSLFRNVDNFYTRKYFILYIEFLIFGITSYLKANKFLCRYML